jgi:hypothetical protein
MNVDATRALVPVQFVKHPVMTIEQERNIHLRQNNNLRENRIPAEESQYTMGDNFAPYDKCLRIPALKGRIVDVYV